VDHAFEIRVGTYSDDELTPVEYGANEAADS
jgi:hypothetical protein